MEYIRKSRNPEKFTVVSNVFIKDNTISWKAKGLILYLMSLPSNWHINALELKEHATDGRESVYSGINELIEAGYCIRIEHRENGRFIGYEYVVSDDKDLILENEVTETEQSFTETPLTGNPFAENPPLLNTKVINTKEQKTKEQNTKKNTLSNDNVQKESKDFDLSFVDWRLSDAFIGWLEYKKGRRQSYKTQKSLELCYKRLVEMADLDIDVARQIIEQSIANNYAGLFPLKNNGYGNSNSNNQSNGNYSGGANAQNSGAFYRNLRDKLAGSL